MKSADESSSPIPPATDDERRDPIEIDPAGARRVWGRVTYVLFFGVVSAALVFVFVKFTASVGIAIGLVVFMVAYMALMGWLASRDAHRRE